MYQKHAFYKARIIITDKRNQDYYYIIRRLDMSDNIDTSAIIERPVYTKDEEYVGVVEDIDKEEQQEGTGNLIIRGNLDLRKYSIPRKFVVSFDDEKLLLDMTRDDFINYAMEK